MFKLKLLAGSLLVLAVIARSYFSPSLFMTEFREVLFEKDPGHLTAYIDFEKLKTNTKAAVSANIGQIAQPSNPFFRMGAAIGNQMFGSIIDTGTTPEIVKVILTSKGKNQEKPEGMFAYDFQYVDFNKVRVNFDDDTVITLERTGYSSWMIVAIEKAG
ncbi:DUF2939 domain-containing protein [Methylobacter sp. BBA5.1]|uniref:DUF2939 domain-containing protein n=1 Tax=Methylobacter sp. BBA5.1 TaxID=1495064 RepID=UPI00056275FA|nr:DUF2939 domain-containing protein [Methylobacter sp. BBA5.1]